MPGVAARGVSGVPTISDITQLALAACTRLMFTEVRANGRHEAASHGSALFGFGVDLGPLSHLGVVKR